MPRANKKLQKQQTLQFNPEQLEVVNAGEGVYRALAGPGSGKSAALVGRTTRLLAEYPPQDILLLTFTSEAAKELRTRIGFEKPEGGRPCGPLTFHSLALSFATLEHDAFPFKLAVFPLATEGQAGKIAGDAVRRHKVDYREFRLWMSKQKRLRITPAAALRTAEKEKEGVSLALAYKDYEDRCRAAGVLDFDSLLVEMVNLLESNAEVRARFQWRWVMCDECQDTDELQFRLLKLVTEKHGNLMCVGDTGQAIYQWRGAHPELFMSMPEMFAGTQTLYLAKNHRSVRAIVEFCAKIGPVKELAERFWTENEDGVEPKITVYPNAIEEAEQVAAAAGAKWLLNPETTVAILSRTNRGLRPVEEWLAEHDIRYHLLSRSGFFSQPEIRAVLAYVQAIKFPSDAALLTALRAPFDCTRFIKKTELADRLKQHKAEDSGTALWGALRQMRHGDPNQSRAIGGFVHFLDSLVRYSTGTATQAVVGVLNDLRALDYYAEEEESAEADSSPVENLQGLIRMSARFPTVGDLLDHARKMQNMSRVKKGVTLGTLHSSKGREWNTVYLIDVSEGNLPHKRGELEEEQRLFFVGSSRPEKELHISYSGIPSRFIQPFLETVRKVDNSEEAVCPAT